jgi:hypothetical protein
LASPDKTILDASGYVQPEFVPHPPFPLYKYQIFFDASHSQSFDQRRRVGTLLGEMRRQSRPIKPRDLGLIGAEHLRAKFDSIGVASESFATREPKSNMTGCPISPKQPLAIVPTGTTVGGSSPGSIGAWPSAAILSAVLGPSTKASAPFSRSNGRALESRSSPSCTSRARGLTISTEGNRV